MWALRPAPWPVGGLPLQGLRITRQCTAAPKTACRGRRCRSTNVGSMLTASIGKVLLVAASGAVIGMARQNGRGPIDLFQKHDANHLVRPGRGAERYAELSLAPQIGRKSVRSADHENSVGDRRIPPAAKMAGKGGAVDTVAALIERHQHRFFRDRGRNRRRFLGNPRCGVARTAFRNFMNLKAAETEFAADVAE